jgi:aminopeptidase N
VWARDVSLANFANEVAPDILTLYEQYTQTSYGMPKVDQVGLEEFWTGAMENWGHVTYM